jgi:TRAP-type uncharacterized transport system fused permease subunit
MGHFKNRLNILERLGFMVIAILFMNSDWRIDLAALVFLAGLVFWTTRSAPASAEIQPETTTGENPADTIQMGETK